MGSSPLSGFFEYSLSCGHPRLRRGGCRPRRSASAEAKAEKLGVGDEAMREAFLRRPSRLEPILCDSSPRANISPIVVFDSLHPSVTGRQSSLPATLSLFPTTPRSPLFISRSTRTGCSSPRSSRSRARRRTRPTGPPRSGGQSTHHTVKIPTRTLRNAPRSSGRGRTPSVEQGANSQVRARAPALDVGSEREGMTDLESAAATGRDLLFKYFGQLELLELR